MSGPDQYFLSYRELLSSRALCASLPEPFLDACRFFGCTMVDRTQTLDVNLGLNIYSPLDKKPAQNKDFATLCRARARFLIDSAIDLQRGLALMWSGGIDSTVALVALLEELEERGRVPMLTVILSGESILEYPSFYRDIIKDKLNVEQYQPPIFDQLCSGKVIVTGEHGDQLFGSDKLKPFVETGEAFRDYRENLPFIIDRKLGTLDRGERILEYLEPQLQKSPVKLVSLYDVLWWMNYSMKWQHVTFRILANQPAHGTLEIDRTLFHFFSNEDFQRWALRPAADKIGRQWRSYKYIAKEYIYNFHPDQDYCENKEKEQSLKLAISNRRHRWMWPLRRSF